jgi:hypothetical protein
LDSKKLLKLRLGVNHTEHRLARSNRVEFISKFISEEIAFNLLSESSNTVPELGTAHGHTIRRKKFVKINHSDRILSDLEILISKKLK